MALNSKPEWKNKIDSDRNHNRQVINIYCSASTWNTDDACWGLCKKKYEFGVTANHLAGCWWCQLNGSQGEGQRAHGPTGPQQPLRAGAVCQAPGNQWENHRFLPFPALTYRSKALFIQSKAHIVAVTFSGVPSFHSTLKSDISVEKCFLFKININVYALREKQHSSIFL